MGHGASIIDSEKSVKLELISGTPCFRSLGEDHTNAILDKLVGVHFEKGEHIISEGQVGSLFGILVSGSVQISARGPNGNEVILCRQERGFYFGEAAIIGNTTTTATITALNSCFIYALTSLELRTISAEMPAVKESLMQTISHRLKQNLLAIPFFVQLQKIVESKKSFKVLGAFDLLSTLFELEAVAAKQTIFKCGDVPQKFYVICEGCIRISCQDCDGNDFMLNMLKKNDVFGEIGLVNGTKRTATARAFEHSLVLTITKEKFDKLFEVFPEFKNVMMPHITDGTMNSIKMSNLFSKMSHQKLQNLASLMEFKDYESGEVIEREGTYNASLYIIVYGKVKAVQRDPDSDKECLLNIMEEGAVMGGKIGDASAS